MKDIYMQNAVKELESSLLIFIIKIICAVLLPFVVINIINEGIDKLNEASYIINVLDGRIHDMSLNLNLNFNMAPAGIFVFLIVVLILIPLIMVYLPRPFKQHQINIKPTNIKNIKIPKNRNNRI